MQLNSLHIRNFRAFEDFEVKKLGQLNLIVGKNNSGKSSVLEALRIYAGNANRSLLNEIASGHDEAFRLPESGQSEDIQELPYEHFFNGRDFPNDDAGAIIIGESLKSASALKINHVFFVEYEEEITGEGDEKYLRPRRKIVSKTEKNEGVDQELKQALAITKNNSTRLYDLSQNSFSRRTNLSSDSSEVVPCAYIPTQFISIDELADIWDKVLFTEYESTAIKGLQIISPECENIAFVKGDSKYSSGSSVSRNEIRRTAKIKMKGASRALPLNSIGDGMLRVLQLILKIVPAKGGFLLIDEFENGLHFSVQKQIWSLLFELAVKLDIQVFATTHSWDCVESFAQVAQERTDASGVLFRVGTSVLKSDKGKIIATVFDEEKLANITQSDVEVR